MSVIDKMIQDQSEVLFLSGLAQKAGNKIGLHSDCLLLALVSQDSTSGSEMYFVGLRLTNLRSKLVLAGSINTNNEPFFVQPNEPFTREDVLTLAGLVAEIASVSKQEGIAYDLEMGVIRG